MPIWEIEEWPARVILEYEAYLRMEPWGPIRDNYHAAMGAHIMANANRRPKSPPIDFSAFMFRDPVDIRQERDSRVLQSFRRKSSKDN